MSDFSQSELSNLWIQAGGPSNVAALMSAIAMAESNGNPDAVNAQSGACGLWQIHPPQPNCKDPFSNARMAVNKYQTQGLGAWEAYTNGAYKAFFGSNVSQSQSSTQSQQNCQTFSSLGVCWDSVVGLGAVILGLVLIAGSMIVIALYSDPGKTAIKTGERISLLVAK